MAIDLKGLSQAQLNELISRAQTRKGELAKEKVDEVREKVFALLKKEGVAFDEVFGSSKLKRKPAKAKYRNPATGDTWSGRGKRPRWFVEALAAGKKEKDLLV
jgi:DNA-binding protein H-NS